MVKLGKTFPILVAFLLTLSLLAVPALAPPVASANGIADLPNPLTVSFSASVSEGDSYSLNVVPNATLGTVINQFSRDWMIINRTSHNNTAARFFNMSTASGTISGDLSGNIDLKWNKVDFALQYFNSSDWFVDEPTGVGILYITGNLTGTILGNLTFVGAGDLDYKDSSVKGEGRVMTVEDWTKGLTTAPDRVLIGEVSYEISGGTISGTFSLRNYSKNPVGLEGRVNTTQEYLLLEGQLTTDEEDWITNNTVEFMQFTRAPVEPYHRIVLEEMAPGREPEQDITAGDMGVGGTISLLRTGVLDVVNVGGQDIPLFSITATRTIENNWNSTLNSSYGGIAKTIVLVDMVNFCLPGVPNCTNPGVDQQSYTMMPGYSEGYLGTGYYAGFESYVIPDTHIDLTLYLKGADYRYVLLPTPLVSSVSPLAGQAGGTLDVTINGKWFWVNETFHPLTIDFGPNVTVHSHAVVSDTQITANITIGGGAGIGPSDVSVTKRGQTGTLSDGFGVGSAVDGQVAFEGRTPARWIEPLAVHFYNSTTGSEMGWSPITATTNSTGGFIVTGIEPGTYDVGIKNCTCLSEAVTGKACLLGQSIVIDFGTVRQGDVNNDDNIDMLDLGTLAAAWGTWPGQPGWEANADFNRDESIDMLDLGTLAGLWGQWGEILDL